MSISLNKLHHIEERRGYNYQDLLIYPQKTTLSRSDVDISSELFDGIVLKTPIISAPMNTISEHKMCIKLAELGGLGILHRFAPPDKIIDKLTEEMRLIGCVDTKYRAFAIGVGEIDFKILDVLSKFASIVCIDLNVGHQQKVLDMIKYIKDNYELKIIAGNVSTYDGAYDLCMAGADCIRATNGGGSACTTIEVTGVGVPTATSLHECYFGVRAAQQQTGHKKTLIADGGIKSSGDMAIAFALGADAIMVGGLLAGSSCCPESAFFTENGEFRARYMGMASREAQIERFGHIKDGTAPEGKSISITPKGKTTEIILDLAYGLKSSFTFVNAQNLNEFKSQTKLLLRS